MDIIMKKTGRYLFFIFIVFILNFNFIFADVQVSVKSSDDRIGVDEPFTIVVTIEGGSGSVVFRDLPDGFKLRSTSQSRDIRVVNFNTVSSQTFYYTYTASKEGLFTIKGIEVKVKNTIYKTKPITIEVVRDSVRVPKRGQGDTLTVNDDDLKNMFRDELYVKNSISKKEAYVNEPIYIQQTLFTRVPLRTLGVSSIPTRADFYSIANSNEYQQTREIINSSDFNVKILREEAIYALKPGTKKIDTASFVFQKTANIFAEQVEKGLDSFTINIIPLPPVKQGIVFSGAVGEFSISTEVSQSNVAISDTIVLRVIVEGDGNTSVIAIPKLNESNITNMFSLYPPKTYETYNFNNGVVSAKKIDEYVLVARSAGTFNFEKITFSFFSPKDKIYKTVESEVTPIKVFESGVFKPNYYEDNGENTYLAIRTNDLNVASKHNVFTDIYVRIYVLTIFIFTVIAFIIVVLKKEKIEKKEKVKKTDDLFLKAKEYYNNNERLLYIKEVYSILTQLLSKNLKVSANSSVSVFVKSLEKNGISDDTIKEIEQILNMCNYEIYGGFIDKENREYHTKIVNILEELKWIYKL